MTLFSKDAAVISVGIIYLRIDAFVFYGYSLLFLSTSALQSLKKPSFAMVGEHFAVKRRKVTLTNEVTLRKVAT